MITRRGAVRLLTAVAGIVSTAMAQSVAMLVGKVKPTETEFEVCKQERAKKVAAMPPDAPWAYVGCERPTSGPPYWCDINADALSGIRLTIGGEVVEVITMAEILAALRPLPEDAVSTSARRF